ncbi:hypothetical protein CYMTET_32987, partial [Cymbomonas tetramitiformis]
GGRGWAICPPPGCPDGQGEAGEAASRGFPGGGRPPQRRRGDTRGPGTRGRADPHHGAADGAGQQLRIQRRAQSGGEGGCGLGYVWRRGTSCGYECGTMQVGASCRSV